ncbi:MAG: prepilin-type N-terminal cleavage/methylation domain-containing protein [Candidatus Harrisonbacteria bacterium]|nr:prepilin-type N-terminal cleavage/methylation domain-containing protein [Candidatus Harrisonbacteria bacterium]MBI2406180.1 prepilin-type N-terminal cleavage/methylation domain-containing protein [Candidatus Harrisonbacteria bacterium]MBI2604311.1 prepilin-type N-terminal cleavage/methylation domain-containing protein [Candidatus Harrisonbacteria bacterium]
MNLKEKKNGFTLIELLLVVAIIGILAAIVIIAINPGKQLSETKDSQRKADFITMLDAVYQFTIDSRGTLPANIPTNPNEICRTPTATSGQCALAGLVDLSVLTDNGTYLAAMPVDSQASTSNGTGYRISTTTGRRVTVYAIASSTLSATR